MKLSLDLDDEDAVADSTGLALALAVSRILPGVVRSQVPQRSQSVMHDMATADSGAAVTAILRSWSACSAGFEKLFGLCESAGRFLVMLHCNAFTIVVSVATMHTAGEHHSLALKCSG